MELPGLLILHILVSCYGLNSLDALLQTARNRLPTHSHSGTRIPHIEIAETRKVGWRSRCSYTEDVKIFHLALGNWRE